jgi:hypothetical protein
VKKAAAERWEATVESDGQFGRWQHVIAKKVEDVGLLIERMLSS